MMEFNYFVEQGAITRDASGRYAIDFVKFPVAVASLAKELLEIEATGNRARAEAWFTKYGTMPADLQAALTKRAACRSTSIRSRRSARPSDDESYDSCWGVRARFRRASS